MLLGSLVDAGVDSSWLKELPRLCGFPQVEVRISRVTRCALQATKVDFWIPEGPHSHEHGHGRTIRQLKKIVTAAQVQNGTKQLALRACDLLGQAEGAVHGRAADEVHLHEVGAIDAVLDLVGVIEGFGQLELDAVYNLPVAVGEGWVTAAHGKLPVPAPATLKLLEGIVVRSGGPVAGEATTPTGAVLVRVLSDGRPPGYWRIAGCGWGAGQRDPSDYPNVLRLVLAEQANEAGLVQVVATDIDDMEPEYVEPLRQALVEAGALDCQVWPTQGKKGRISLRLEALVPEGASDRVAQALFTNSTTTGIRSWSTVRSTLVRKEMLVELNPAVKVRVKVREGPQGIGIKPEYDDVVRAARDLGIPVIEAAHKAEKKALEVLDSGQGV
jgi:uncharacterized protein (TIGR00299 family) protein